MTNNPVGPVIAAVFGKPIGHSLSPQLFRLMWSQQGRDDHRYLRIHTDSIDTALMSARLLGLSFANITHPLKQSAFAVADNHYPSSRLLQAANRLDFLPDETTVSANTDPDGIRYALRCLLPDERTREVLVVGSGGAAAATLAALQDSSSNVSVTYRNSDVLPSLQKIRPFTPVNIDHCPALAPRMDLIVWTLPGYPPELALPSLAPHHKVLNARYGMEPPPGYFGEANLTDGLSWLVGQGIATFESRFGILPHPEILRDHLRNVPDNDHGLPKSRHIALVGFMGAGKTTTGAILSRYTKRPWLDVDSLIEERKGMSIPEIFQKYGEPGFRQLESETICSLDRGMPPSVLSLGGGAPTQTVVRNWIAQNCIVFWLLRIPVVHPQLQLNRPMLNSADPIVLFRSRIPHYADVSDVIIPVTEWSTPHETAMAIMGELQPE